VSDPPKNDRGQLQPAVSGTVETRSTRIARTPNGTNGQPRRVSTRDLLGPNGIVWIEHDGEVYTLRRTRAGRLILTK
jgi:hemin uptake protein HemP